MAELNFKLDNSEEQCKNFIATNKATIPKGNFISKIKIYTDKTSQVDEIVGFRFFVTGAGGKNVPVIGSYTINETEHSIADNERILGVLIEKSLNGYEPAKLIDLQFIIGQLN